MIYCENSVLYHIYLKVNYIVSHSLFIVIRFKHHTLILRVVLSVGYRVLHLGRGFHHFDFC